MGDRALRTGWRIFRDRYHDVVPLTRRRLRFRIGLAAAVVTGVFCTVAASLWGWASSPVAAVGGTILLAAGVGTAAAFFVPLAPRRTDWRAPAGDWRRDERVRRQFAARPPAIDPADRDLVLEAAERSRDPLVLLVARSGLIPLYWLAGGAGLLLLTFGARPSFIVLFTPVMALLQSSMLVFGLTSLGRVDAARRRAEAMPPAPPTPVRQPRRSGTPGSKLGLPGD